MLYRECPSIFHAVCNTGTLSKMSGASSDPFTYLCVRTTATTKGNNQTPAVLIPLSLNTTILKICFFFFWFVFVKMDEV